MTIKRERVFGASRCERMPERRADAGGDKPRRIDMATGTVTVEGFKTAGRYERFVSPDSTGQFAPCRSRLANQPPKSFNRVDFL